MINSYIFNEAAQAPTGLTATSIQQTTFTLSWTTSSGSVSGYKIYKGGVLYSDVGNVITIGITGQTEGATNTWTIKAYNGAGDLSSASSGLSVTQAVTVYSFSMSSTGRADATTACADAATTTRYLTANGTLNNGNVIYTTAGGINKFNGGGLYFSDTTFSFTVSSVGVIGNKLICSG